MCCCRYREVTFANRWTRKLASLLLVLWGLCAVGCGLATNFKQLKSCVFLGVAESGVFRRPWSCSPITSSERARAKPIEPMHAARCGGFGATHRIRLFGKWGWNRCSSLRESRLSGCLWCTSSAIGRVRRAGFREENSNTEKTRCGESLDVAKQDRSVAFRQPASS